MKYNVGSSVYVKPELNQEHPEKPISQRFYVCLQACIEGFKEGCRPIIGLDGGHLKGVYTGQVLSAIAQAGNDNIFPIAFAVVKSEKKSTWCWFLENLIRVIGGQALTFMSDRQKGLLEALKLIVPNVDTRVCVRHLLNNFSKQWHGKTYKDVVYAAAKAAMCMCVSTIATTQVNYPTRKTKKSRNREPREEISTKQTRLGTRKNKCGNCGEEGHIRKTCKNPPKAST